MNSRKVTCTFYLKPKVLEKPIFQKCRTIWIWGKNLYWKLHFSSCRSNKSKIICLFCLKASSLCISFLSSLWIVTQYKNRNSDRDPCTFHLKLSACLNPRIHINVWIVRYNIMIWVSNEHRDDDNIIEIVMKYHFSR